METCPFGLRKSSMGIHPYEKNNVDSTHEHEDFTRKMRIYMDNIWTISASSRRNMRTLRLRHPVSFAKRFNQLEKPKKHFWLSQSMSFNRPCQGRRLARSHHGGCTALQPAALSLPGSPWHVSARGAEGAPKRRFFLIFLAPCKQ